MSEKYHPLKSPYHPLKHLAVLRHEPSDEIPAEVIHSKGGKRYKVQGGWWGGVINTLQHATQRGMIADEELKQRIGEFTTKVLAMRFGDDTPASLRTAADIAWANQFIDQVLAATGYADTPLDLSDLNR